MLQYRSDSFPEARLRIATVPELRERTTFVGREREQTLLLEEIERGVPLLSITGPSGLGKTRLALQVARRASRFFEKEGGTWFCDLSQSREASDVELAVARALGMPQLHGEELLRAIEKRGRILLLLDNFDSVAGELEGLFGPWLDRCFNLQVIGTSIVPIGMAGEFDFALGPLEQEDAIELYLERARRASVGWSIPSGDEPLVEELVRRLDRIPLAIELASARVRVFSPRALLARLDERLELLRGGEPGRHSSLEDALTLTWSLLSSDEKLLLSKASIVPSGFGVDAAQALLGASREEEVLELLDGLRAKSLLHIVDGEHPRFFLFECVQIFARQALSVRGEEERAYREHRSFLIRRAEEWAALVEGPQVLSALAWLQAETKNLTAILRRDWEREPGQAVRAGLALLVSLEREGFPSGSLSAIDLSLVAARRDGDPARVARALLSLGKAKAHHAQLSAAHQHLREGLALAREAGDAPLVGKLHLELATSLTPTGSEGAIDGHIEEAIRIGRAEQLPSLESAGLVLLGNRLSSQGRTDEALEKFWASIQLLQDNNLRWHESKAWNCYGVGLTFVGRLGEARVALQEALSRAQSLDSRVLEAGIRLNLGGLELAAGNLDEAASHCQDALELQRRLGSRQGEVHCLANLGVVALCRGDARLALEHLRASTTLAAEGNHKEWVASLAIFLGVAEAKRGSLAQGRQTLSAGRSFFNERGSRRNRLAFELADSILDVLEAQQLRDASSERAGALIHGAQQTLSKMRAAPHAKENSYEAARLLERELAAWEDPPAAPPPAPVARPTLIGRDGGWFELPGKDRADLRRRVAIRKILAALIRRREERPNEGLTAHQLFEAGWPGVEIQQESAIRRVYISIWTLRDFGLADLILNRSDGYLLDPDAPIEIVEGDEAAAPRAANLSA